MYVDVLLVNPPSAHERYQQVRKVIAAQGIKVYVPPVDADDEASAEHSQALMVSRHHLISAHP